jgi:hypothetical protein
MMTRPDVYQPKEAMRACFAVPTRVVWRLAPMYTLTFSLREKELRYFVFGLFLGKQAKNEIQNL